MEKGKEKEGRELGHVKKKSKTGSEKPTRRGKKRKERGKGWVLYGTDEGHKSIEPAQIGLCLSWGHIWPVFIISSSSFLIHHSTSSNSFDNRFIHLFTFSQFLQN